MTARLDLEALKAKRLDGLAYVHGIRVYSLTPDEWTALLAELSHLRRVEAAARALELKQLHYPDRPHLNEWIELSQALAEGT